MMKNLLLTICALFSITYLNGQGQDATSSIETNQNERVVSQLASSKSNIDPSTGALNTIIPLFNIDLGETQLPISLTYNGQGRKYSEQASWVGYGWNLDYGGIIHRQANGLPDDIPFEDSGNNFEHVRGYLNHSLVQSDLPTDNPNHLEYKYAGWGNMDYQPDVFSYSFAGQSSRFSLNRGDDPCSGEVIGDVVEFPKSQNRISVRYSTSDNEGYLYDWGSCFDFHLDLEGFDIKTKMGVEYSFEKGDRSTMYSSEDRCSSIGLPRCKVEYYDTWFLDKIKNVEGQELASFEYSSSAYDYEYNVPSQTAQIFHNNYTKNVWKDQNNRLIDEVKVLQAINLTYNRKLVFIKTVLGGKPFLTRVNLYQGEEGNEQLISYVKIYYDNYNEETRTIRKVGYYNGSGVEYDFVEFSYYPETNRASEYELNDYDYWGFINGVDQKARIPNVMSSRQARLNKGRADRRPQLYKTRHKALESISYSSGKSESFTYELNEYSRIAGEDDDITWGHVQTQSVLIQYDQLNTTSFLPVAGPTTFFNVDGAEYPNGQYVNFEIDLLGLENDDLDRNLCDRFLMVQIWDEDDNFIADFYSGYAELEPLIDFDKGTQIKTIALQPGNYKLKAKIRTDWGTLNPFDYEVVCPYAYRIKMFSKKPAQIKEAGGLRVEEHSITDNNGNEVISKYHYDRFDSPDKSSGILLNPLLNQVEIQEHWTQSGTVHELFLLSSSNFINNRTFTKKGPVIYTNVSIETTGFDEEGNAVSSFNQIGKTEITNSFDHDIYDDPQGYPYGRKWLRDWEVGLPVKIVNKDVSGKKVSEIEHVYGYAKKSNGSDETFGFSYGTNFALRKLNWSVPQGIMQSMYSFYGYMWISKYFYKKTEISKFFDEEENIVDQVITNYFIDNPDELLEVDRIEKVLQNGTKFITKIKHIGDYNLFSGVVSDEQSTSIVDLKSNHEMLAWPVEKTNYIDDGNGELLLRSSINFYGLRNGNQDVPRLVYTRESSFLQPIPGYQNSRLIMPGPVNSDVSFSFNESLFSENYTEVTRLNDEFVSIESVNSKGDYSSMLMDDNRAQVVAKMQRGKLTISRYTSFETDFHGGWNLSEEDMANHVVDATPTEQAITGDKYYYLGTIESNNGQFNSGVSTNPFPAGKYLLSYWKKGNVTIALNNSGTILSTNILEEGDWIYVEQIIEWGVDGNYLTIGGDAYIDELRFREVNATMETFGYYRDGKLKYKSDPASNVLTYEYDNKGRLEWLLDRERNVIEHHVYDEKDIADEDSYNKHVLYSVRKEGMSKSDVQNASYNNHDVKKSITYTDGLGRRRQSIAMNINPSNRDAISFTKYDAFGRSLKTNLPYYAHLGNDDDYILDAETQQLAYYQNQDDDQENTTKPFAEKELEKSPLQRPIEQGGVGEELQLGGGHTTQMEYGWNDATDQILKWNYDESTEIASVASGSNQYWAANTLRKTTMTSPDGIVSAVFKDARGREIARTVYADLYGDKTTGDIGQLGSKTAHQVTQYSVYDDFNRLRYDISPKAVQAMEDVGSYTLNPDAPSTAFLEQISFYRYDEKGRLQRRFSPGNQSVEYVYDKRDRVILTRDAMQTEEGKWSFVKFDSKGRAILTGEYESTNDRAYNQQQADAQTELFETLLATPVDGSPHNYTDVAYPTGIGQNDFYTASYFDNYDFIPSSISTFDFVPFNGIAAPLEVTRGLPTGSRVLVFDGDGVYDQNLMTLTYYDEDARPIQAITENHKGGWDRIDTYYNDLGQVEKTVQTHKYDANSDEHIFTTRFTYYDQTGQLRYTYCQLDDDPEVLVSNRFYDVKGQLKDLKLHSVVGVSNYLQNIDYRYNAQGRLTHINNTALIDDGINEDDDDIFGQELTYFEESPEYHNPGSVQQGDPLANYNFRAQYGGNVSSMMWNAKAPEEDGTTLSRSVYVYDYDHLGQMTHAYYAADDPSMPGEFVEDLGHYDEHVNYDLGGNIVKLNRHNGSIRGTNELMDELTYTYSNGGYELQKVIDAGLGTMSTGYKHFVDGSNVSNEYDYDAGGKMTKDLNKQIQFAYNPMNLPKRVDHLQSAYYVTYTYDAAGNKLQKYLNIPECPPDVHCNDIDSYAIDYIGNFVYEDGELKMVYHPEGVIRPTPNNADNETDYVYDYFVKDYLGNVRAVITEEDAVLTDKFLATLEEVHAVYEEENFDNIHETRVNKPTGYPADGSLYLNEKVASLSAANGTEMGPSLVMPVKRGDKVNLSSKYFYEEDAPGTIYDDLGYFVNEILIALATSGAGVLPLNEGQLINIASGDPAYVQSVTSLLNSSFDDRDIHKPNAYLVWMLYDKNMRLIPKSSGAIQVQNPNALETLISNAINISDDGYLHAYVSNGSSKGVHFDQFLVQRQRGKVRQINDYYPYGLTLTGLNGDGDEYLNKYTAKELQTGEFNATVATNSTGIEMFDFGSRYYDPQLGRWFTPDPAEQFTNPYLGIGNNPVVYVDPNGEEAITAGAAILIGMAIAATSYTAQVAMSDQGFDNWDWGQFIFSTGIGAVSGAATFGIGNAFGAVGTYCLPGEIGRAAAHGAFGGFTATVAGGDFLTGFAAGSIGSLGGSAFSAFGGSFAQSTAGQIGFSAFSGGVGSAVSGGDFVNGLARGAMIGLLNHAMHKIAQNSDRTGNKTDGTATVYIETDGVGHAYIEVNGTVFSYGRYNGSYSPSSGAFGPIGEGVLYKKTGDAAKKFIAERTAKYPTKQYSFEVNTTATYNYYNNVYNAGVYNTFDSRVIDTYLLIGNNCTTGVCGALQAGGSGMPIIQTPAGFVDFMYDINRMQNGWNPGAVVPWEPKY